MRSSGQLKLLRHSTVLCTLYWYSIDIPYTVQYSMVYVAGTVQYMYQVRRTHSVLYQVGVHVMSTAVNIVRDYCAYQYSTRSS